MEEKAMNEDHKIRDLQSIDNLLLEIKKNPEKYAEYDIGMFLEVLKFSKAVLS